MALTRTTFLDIANWSVEQGAETDFSTQYFLACRLPSVSKQEILLHKTPQAIKQDFLMDVREILESVATISDLKKEATLAKSRVSNIGAGLGRFAKMLDMEEASTPEQIITALETHLMRQALGLPVTTEKK